MVPWRVVRPGDVQPVESKLVGEYRLGERLGGGGFGEVFAATHEVIGGDVAIKILHAHRCSDPVAVARFTAEARAVNKIRHPGIVDVFAFGALADGRQYFVMERLHGRTLRSILDESGALPLERALPILRAVAAAVDAAHTLGVTHRDLKPDNVFVCDDETIKLIDFGIAKLSTDTGVTETGTVLGTPLYMAPEQCRGAAVDERSDLYAFGALAYHMLVGTPVFDGDPLALALHHVNDRPEPPTRRDRGLPRQIDAPLLALLSKDPADRPRPLALVVERLAAPPRPERRRLAIGAVAAIAAAGAIVFIARRDTDEPKSPPPALLDASQVKVVTRTLPIPPNNLHSIDPAGRFILYLTQTGPMKLDLDGETNAVVDAPFYGRVFPDGRIYGSDRPGLGTQVITGAWPELCDERVAMIENERLVVFDLATQKSRDLGPAPGVWGVRWSPSCTQLVWTNSVFVVQLTDMARGTTRALALPIETDMFRDHTAAFVGEDALLYCNKDRQLSLHYLDGRAGDQVLAQLDSSISTCQVATSGDGRRAVILATTQKTRGEVVMPGAAPPALVPLPDLVAGEYPELFLDDERMIVTRRHRESAYVEPLTPASVAVDRTSSLLHNGRRTPVKTCAGESTIALRDKQIVHVVVDDRASASQYMFLEDGTCRVLDTWTVPGADGWSRPSCVGATCVAGRIADRRLTIYELVTGKPSPRVVAEIADDLRDRDGPPSASVALAPDRTQIVALKVAAPVFHLVDLATGARRTLRYGRGLDPAFDYPAWGPDATHFYMTTNGFTGDAQPYGLTRFAMDGTFDTIVTASHKLDLVASTSTRLGIAQRTREPSLLIVALPPLPTRALQ